MDGDKTQTAHSTHAPLSSYLTEVFISLGMCLGNGSGSTGQISWICGGSFGRLNLSCSRIDTYKKADSINCEAALISLGEKGESEKSKEVWFSSYK